MGSSKIDRGELVAGATAALTEYRHLKAMGFINRDGTFFPAGVHYPPITRYPPISQHEMFDGYHSSQDGLFDIYVHIPFCMRRCAFCHYPVKLGEQEAEKDLYLQYLEREMDISMGVLGVRPIRARSVLVGGGTPTYLAPRQMRSFLRSITSRLDLSRCTQFSFDVDPVTLLGPAGTERLAMMRDHGVDRLTIGVQSLDDPTLVRMNRPHNVKEALDAIEVSRRLGLQLNVEFIFGYPGQTLDTWMDDIEKAMALDVDEIQMYRLKIDAYGDYQGPIKGQIERRAARVTTDEEDVVMKRVAIDMLTSSGFSEPIRRVFSRKKSLLSHYAWNQCCMLLDELGFGLTAFSSLRDRFVLNTQYFEEYYSKISAGQLPLNRGAVRNPEEQMRWAFILPLKNSCVRRTVFEQRTGVPLHGAFRDKVEQLKSHGLLVEHNDRIESTARGAFYADELSHQFHAPEHVPFLLSDYTDGPLNPYHGAGVGAGRSAAGVPR